MQTPDPVVPAADVPDVPVIVLLASALLGPAPWEPVERELRSRGYDVIIAPPSDEADPVTPTDAALSYATAVPADRRVILVPHSNAGNFVATLIDIRVVACVVFVDAVIPVESGIQPLAPPTLLDRVEPLVDDDGLLPVWTDWFDEEDIARLFPDPATRFHIEAQQPQLPLKFLRGALRIDPGWDTTPAGYLAFGSTYADDVARARSRGWPVIELDGRHLHMLVDPVGVTDAILELVSRTAPEP
ncbi:hypothetical protein [Mycetocola zhujimingii]|uniref:Alpha/beta hydrolase n=1 Tax=Mycetocola zhujimingii TaxID=2079792 RepID=A0A2U1TDY2_9MICO|nr:hypothetical protein [Mycetocola zhujimingii]PWC06983.1 hypothetical protein DF223_08400 [Mycetocola zhujimingii]